MRIIVAAFGAADADDERSAITAAGVDSVGIDRRRGTRPAGRDDPIRPRRGRLRRPDPSATVRHLAAARRKRRIRRGIRTRLLACLADAGEMPRHIRLSIALLNAAAQTYAAA